MKGSRNKKRIAALVMSMLLLFCSVPMTALGFQETGTTTEQTGSQPDTVRESTEMPAKEDPLPDEGQNSQSGEGEKEETASAETDQEGTAGDISETPGDQENGGEAEEGTGDQNSTVDEGENAAGTGEAENGLTDQEQQQDPDGQTEADETEEAETPEAPQDQEESSPEDQETESFAVPLTAALSDPGSQAGAPEHHKYIRCNGEDSYTLTLDVKGMYDSETNPKKLDVLLIVDRSGSMDYSMGRRQTRMDVLKDIITRDGGLSDAILNNSAIDGRMAVVSYSGSKDDEGRRNTYNDASTNCEWTDKRSAVNYSVNRLSANGGTNCEAGLRTGAEVLQSARSDAQKIVIFLSDGQPTYRYDSDGRTAGDGSSDGGGRCASAAYTQAEKITGLEAFYVVGISNESPTDFLNTLATKPGANDRHVYQANDADDLSQVFDKITAGLTEYVCRNVTISDTLSEYVEIPESGLSGRVSAVNENGETQDISGVGIRVSYDSATRTVTAVFPKGYQLNREWTYSVSFDVTPSQTAYDTYADAGYNATGSEGSDAPGNHTSEGKEGFYSNTSASLTYTYGTDNAQPQTVDYVEKPVVQVSSVSIPVEKRWVGVEGTETPGSVTVHLYRDDQPEPYRTITLSADSGWKGEFSRLAKGHTYRVEEAEIPGYISEITEDSSGGYVITNTYDLKEVTVTKQWMDADNADKVRPSSIQVQLMNGKTPVGDPVLLGYGEDGGLLEGTTVSQDGNAWSYTWTKLPKTDENGREISYTAKEISEITGYETSYSEDGLTITNTRLPSLTVEKKVTGAMGDKTAEFRIEITLKDSSGEDLSGTYCYTKTLQDGTSTMGGAAVENGKLTVSLKDGETYTLSGLPAGCSYSVEENADDASGYQVTYQENKEGTLDKSCQVTVVNNREEIPATGIGGLGNGILPAAAGGAVLLLALGVGSVFRRRYRNS